MLKIYTICEKKKKSSNKFESDILMNILFILDANFIKSEADTL